MQLFNLSSADKKENLVAIKAPKKQSANGGRRREATCAIIIKSLSRSNLVETNHSKENVEQS
jgi:hypothetical protein